MRVVYVGNFEPEWSTENDVRLAFEALGHDVVQQQENRLRADHLREVALESDLLLWTGTWPDAIDLAQALDIFHACATAGIPTATLHLDVFWSTGRGGRRWWREPMFHTAHLFTADGDHQAEWERLGKRHTWLPPGVRHTAAHPGTARDPWRCDVAFVGSDGHGYHEDVWPYRRLLVDALEAMCERRGWSFLNPGGRQPKVDRGSMNDFYASATVTVGDSLCIRRRASRYWSDRAYEAPGRNGFLIMPMIDALVMDYDGVLPTYDWGDFDDLERTIEAFLDDADEREHRRDVCHEIASNRHTYVQRVESLLDAL